jgi:hypothetical protein
MPPKPPPPTITVIRRPGRAAATSAPTRAASAVGATSSKPPRHPRPNRDRARDPRPPVPTSERDDGALTVENFRDDPQFARIEAAVAEILANGKVVAPVDVLVKMELLASEDLAAWRAGGVPFLESVVRSRLGGLSRLLRILRFHVHDLKLVVQQTEYVRSYDGQVVKLRFTKSGDPKVEQAYAKHFVWPGKGPFRMPRK